MTINKAQGQVLEVMGLNLAKSVSSLGQEFCNDHKQGSRIVLGGDRPKPCQTRFFSWPKVLQ